MTSALIEAARRCAEAGADRSGIARTPIPGLAVVRATEAGALRHAAHRLLLCLVVQGAKQVAAGGRTRLFAAGDTTLAVAEQPAASRVTRASCAAPYLALAFRLDPALVADLSAEMEAVPAGAGASRPQPTDAEVADTALRMLRLLDRPASVPVLGAQLVREMHHWLLAGRHGPAVRRLGPPGDRARRIARAVAVIRSELAAVLPVERLAAVAGMSPSTFHRHFRAVSSCSPRHFQQRLRLIEARRMMLADGATPGRAADAVGYGSVPQFTREYRRMFGMPPARETRRARHGAEPASSRLP